MSINTIIIGGKTKDRFIQCSFIILPTGKFFEMLPKHNEALLISQLYALYLYISTLLTNI